MPTLFVTEYSYAAQAQGAGQFVPAGREPAVAMYTVPIGGSSAQSQAFNIQTNFVRLHSDSICSVAFGLSPTATTTSSRMAANQTEFFGVMPGQKVAVISNV